jgi:SAM-dependent methyltransferase
MTTMPETQRSEDQPRDRSTQEYWDVRHATSRPEASGTLTHSSAANRWFYRAKKKRILEIANRLHISLKGLRVLDAACGSGEFIDFFLREGAGYILGLDFSLVAVSSCEKRFSAATNCHFSCLDLSKVLPDEIRNTFDLVCCFEAIYLLPSEADFQTCLRNLCAALKPGGHLLISDHYPATAKRRHDDLVHRSHDLYKKIFNESHLREIGRHLQTTIFNASIFPSRIQSCVDIYFPWSLYVIDRLLLRLRRPVIPLSDRFYYLIAEKEL